MDFVDWCGLVLDKLIEASRTSAIAAYDGVDPPLLARTIFGEEIADRPEFPETTRSRGIRTALRELSRTGAAALVYEPILKVTDRFRVKNWEGSEGLMHSWPWRCARPLQPREEELLRLLNRLSQHEADDHAWLEIVDERVLVAELGWPEGRDLVRLVAKALERHQFASPLLGTGAFAGIHATYSGLVRETRYHLTWETQRIDELVGEWETTSVEFKRDVRTDTPKQKAELIKDVLGLSNTQASGRRWLIIGFDDKTRTYAGPPDPKLTQEHLERLMAEYTQPVLAVRYQVIDYRAGKVGKLEVLREPAKLPYRVARPIGHYRQTGEVFVRHGSLTEPPSPDELQAIQDEGDRARAGSP